MEMGKEYVNARGDKFVPHAIEAEDFVGTLFGEKGECRHIVPRDAAGDWKPANNSPLGDRYVVTPRLEETATAASEPAIEVKAEVVNQGERKVKKTK